MGHGMPFPQQSSSTIFFYNGELCERSGPITGLRTLGRPNSYPCRPTLRDWLLRRDFFRLEILPSIHSHPKSSILRQHQLHLTLSCYHLVLLVALHLSLPRLSLLIIIWAVMLAPSQSARLLSRSAIRLLSLPSTASRTARAPLRLPQTASISRRTFTAYPRLQEAAVAENEEQRYSSPEITKFQELADHGIIHPHIIKTVTDKMNITTMTDVQRMTINECLDGSDVVGQAKTGTGKTIAFLMPIIQRLMRDKSLSGRAPSAADTRALIISPTRELAEQIAVEATKICQGTGVKIQTAVGGTQKRYHLQLMQRQGCHILVGTPGRIKDIISDPDSGVTLHNIQTFVLDEADRLLDIGFAPDIKEIESYMPNRNERDRQTLMFSATIPKTVVGLVRDILKDDFKFIRASDPDEQPTHERIPQKVVYLPGLQNLMPAITEIAVKAVEANRNNPQENKPFKAIIFMRSLSEVALLKKWLDNLRDTTSGGPGSMFGKHPLSPAKVYEMSSSLTQRERSFNTDGFRRAESGILVCSDVAARGMDFPDVSHVIQTHYPQSIDQYIHRVGRTGRAGKDGIGYLLLQSGDRMSFSREFARDLKLKEDSQLETALVDMTRPAELPAHVARIMSMVEAGARAIPFSVKASAYRVLLSAMGQGSRDKQATVDMLNEFSRYGFGLETPPSVPASTAQRIGFARTSGLNIESASYDDRRGGFGDRRGPFDDRRGGYGGRDDRGGDRRDSRGGMGVNRGMGALESAMGDGRRGGGRW
jgi:ATP-dependent RNA helicase MSS116, mitochondrial